LTTCAIDYVTWKNELDPGVETINGVTVRRFKVKHARSPETFGRLSDRVFRERHSVSDELAWIDAEGPTSTALIDFLSRHGAEYDYCLFFSYRYYHAFHGARATASRAVLVPTAERDSAIGLAIFPPVFRGVRAVMYNSPEERAMIHAVAGNDDVPGVVVGIGSDVPQNPQPNRFRQKHRVRGPFAIYVGRIDRNKGCQELFDYFGGYLRESAGELSLMLVGHPLLPIPDHPRIRHLGFVDDLDKFDAMAAADVLIMPSYFESLSMVALEAWALGRPVLVNGACDVLKGQCLRSNAGLYYDSYAEFVETLRALEQHKWLGATLGRNGRQYFREHYDWSVIEGKYLSMFAQLGKTAPRHEMEPLPGWARRRRRNLPPAEEIATGLPVGPATDRETSRGISTRPEPTRRPA